MTEAELMAGITDALTLAGWRWTHIRRSDGITVGASGLPDIIAAHPLYDTVLAWELKSATGQPTADQTAWLLGLNGRTIDARVIRPRDYDDVLGMILAPR